MVNGTLLEPSKYGTISKASRRDKCWFVGKFIISMDCIGMVFGKLFGALFDKLFAKISLLDFLKVEYGCEDFSESRAWSIFAVGKYNLTDFSR